MTETGQIRQDKAIFHTIRMSSRAAAGWAGVGRPDFSQRGDAPTAT